MPPSCFHTRNLNSVHTLCLLAPSFRIKVAAVSVSFSSVSFSSGQPPIFQRLILQRPWPTVADKWKHTTLRCCHCYRRNVWRSSINCWNDARTICSDTMIAWRCSDDMFYTGPGPHMCHRLHWFRHLIHHLAMICLHLTRHVTCLTR